MNKAEKCKFVNDLMTGITKTVLSKIDAMPDSWDGVELREYIRDTTKRHMWTNLNKRQSRFQDYKWIVLVNNL